jgi:hypothetical protein
MKNRRYLILALALMAISFASTLASAQSPITSLYNTGVDDTGALLNVGVADTHYKILSGPSPLYTSGFPGGLAYTTNPHPLWWHPSGNPSALQWIDPLNNGNASSPGYVPNGTYRYETTFYLVDCVDPTKVQLMGQFASDDNACIWVNGQNTNQCAINGYATPTSFNISGSTLFHSGTNIVDFVVQNIGGGPSGLIVTVLGKVNP